MLYIFNIVILTIFLSFTPSRTAHCHKPEEVTIIFASHMAEIQPVHPQEGLAQLSTLLKESRAKKKHVLFFHGGAALAPSILSSFDRGSHMISLLNILEPDVMAVAKSDLAHKEDELTLRTFEAAFPFVNSNLFDPLTGSNIEGTLPFLTIKTGRFILGIMSLIDPEVITDYMPERVKIVDTTTTILETTKALRVRGADLIILLADYLPPTIDQWLDSKIVDIALISDPRLTPRPNQKSHNYYELDTNSGVACILSLTLTKKKPMAEWTGNIRTVPLMGIKKDPAITKEITKETEYLAGILSKKIGKTLTPIDTRRISVRTKENGFGNFIADTLRDFYSSDIALINGGAIRGNREYSAGTMLTRRDIHRELPFSSRITKIRVTGRQIFLCLENGLSKIENEKGRFPHFSGMHVTYNPDNPPGRRVLTVMIGGTPINLNRHYTLATLDYLTKGGDGYDILKNSKELVKIGGGKSLWEYVKNRISSEGEISPTIDGRLRAIAN